MRQEVSVERWLIIRSTRSGGEPTRSRAVWGIAKSDPSGLFSTGEIVFFGGVESIEHGIVQTQKGVTLKLEGEGREVEIPLKMLSKIKSMTADDWSRFILNQIKQV